MSLWVIALSVLSGAVILLWVSRYYAIQLHNRLAHHRCPNCGYFKHGSTSQTCPECGSPWGDGARIQMPGLAIWVLAPLRLLALYVVLPVLILGGIIWIIARL